MTDWQMKHALELRDAGQSIGQIARAMNMSKGKIQATLARIQKDLEKSEITHDRLE